MERFHCLALVLLSYIAGATARWNNLNCPAPRAPENGLSFIFRNGELVHFRCHPGYFMRGKAIAHCIHNQWSDPPPECISTSYQEFRSATSFHPTHSKDKAHKHKSPQEDGHETAYEIDNKANRQLFNWGDDSKHNTPHSTTNAPYGDGPRRLPIINGLWRPPETRVLTIAPQPSPLRTSVSPFIKPSSLMKEEVDIAELRQKQMEEVMKTRITEGNPDETSRPEKKRRRPKKDRKHRQNAVLVDSKDSDTSQAAAHSTVSFGSSDGTEITISYSLSNNGTAPDKVKRGRHKYRHDEQKRRRKGKKRKWNTPGPHLISRASRVEMVRHRPSTSYRHRPEYGVAELRHRPVEVTRGLNGSSLQNDSDSIYFTHEFDTSCLQTIYGHEVPMISPQIPHAFVYRYETRRNKNYPYNSYLQVKYRCLIGFELENPKLNALYCREKAWVGHVPKCIVKTGD